MKIVLIGGPRHREEYDPIGPPSLIADYSRKTWPARSRPAEPTDVCYYIHRSLGDDSARASIEKHKRGEPEPVPPRH